MTPGCLLKFHFPCYSVILLKLHKLCDLLLCVYHLELHVSCQYYCSFYTGNTIGNMHIEEYNILWNENDTVSKKKLW